MLPPGLSFNAICAKALKAAEAREDAAQLLGLAADAGGECPGFFPYTPATNLLYGLDAAVDMLMEEGLDNVFARHDRFAEATRRAVRAWGLEVQVEEPRRVFLGADRGAAAGGPQRQCAARDHPRASST